MPVTRVNIHKAKTTRIRGVNGVKKKAVHRVNDLVVHVYRDHNPPHFHVISKRKRMNAKLTLRNLELIGGTISMSDLRKIKTLYDIKKNYGKLLKEYSKMNF